jgi:hypothetical protein
MIEMLKIHALVRAARLLLVIAHAADYVRKVACRKAEAIAIEATAWCDARTRLTAGRGNGEWNAKSLIRCPEPDQGRTSCFAE